MRPLLAVLFALLLAAPPARAEIVTQGLSAAAEFDASGRLHLSAGGSGGGSFTSRPAGGAWSLPVTVLEPEAGRASLDVSPAGGTVAGWLGTCGDGTCGPRLATGAGGAWTGGYATFPVVEGVPDPPRVAVDDAGNATAVWAERSVDDLGTYDNRLYATRREAGGVWSQPAMIAALGGGDGYGIAAPREGDAWVVYARADQTDGEDLQARRLHGGAWQPPETVFVPPQDRPFSGFTLRVAAESPDVPTVAWSDVHSSVHTSDVWAARRDPADGAWAAKQLTGTDQGGDVSGIESDAGGVTVAFHDNGQYVAFQDTKGTVGTVRHGAAGWEAPIRYETDSGWKASGDLSIGTARSALAAGLDGSAALAYADGASLALRTRHAGAWGARQLMSTRVENRGFSAASPAFTVAVDPGGVAEVVFRAGDQNWLCARREGGDPGPGVCSGEASDDCPGACQADPPASPGPDGGGGPPGDPIVQPPIEDFLLTGFLPRGLRLRTLLRKGSHRLTIAVPGPGTLEVKWNHGRTLVASGRSASGRLTMKLTKAGRRRLRRARRVRLTARVSFRPASGQPLRATRAFTLRR
jgi:hypothetical protein